MGWCRNLSFAKFSSLESSPAPPSGPPWPFSWCAHFKPWWWYKQIRFHPPIYILYHLNIRIAMSNSLSDRDVLLQQRHTHGHLNLMWHKGWSQEEQKGLQLWFLVSHISPYHLSFEAFSILLLFPRCCQLHHLWIWPKHTLRRELNILPSDF